MSWCRWMVALGEAGRAGAVQPERHVVLAGVGRFQFGRCCGQQVVEVRQAGTVSCRLAAITRPLPAGRQLVWARALPLAGYHNVFEVLQAIADFPNPREDGRVDHEHPGAAVVEHVLVAFRLQGRVQRQGHCPDLHRAEKGVGPLRCVRQQDGDAFLDPRPQGLQRVPEAIDAFRQVPVGDGPVTAQDGSLVAPSLADVDVHKHVGRVQPFRQVGQFHS